jgi:hypothetical protein
MTCGIPCTARATIGFHSAAGACSCRSEENDPAVADDDAEPAKLAGHRSTAASLRPLGQIGRHDLGRVPLARTTKARWSSWSLQARTVIAGLDPRSPRCSPPHERHHRQITQHDG